jgi:hypothetical protein
MFLKFRLFCDASAPFKCESGTISNMSSVICTGYCPLEEPASRSFHLGFLNWKMCQAISIYHDPRVTFSLRGEINYGKLLHEHVMPSASNARPKSLSTCRPDRVTRRGALDRRSGADHHGIGGEGTPSTPQMLSSIGKRQRLFLGRALVTASTSAANAVQLVLGRGSRDIDADRRHDRRDDPRFGERRDQRGHRRYQVGTGDNTIAGHRGPDALYGMGGAEPWSSPR